jgi:hypothetical protein
MINDCIAMCRRFLERRVANIKIERCAALAPSAATPVSELASEIAVQLSATSAGCGKRALHTGLFNLHTTDGHRVTRTFLVQSRWN